MVKMNTLSGVFPDYRVFLLVCLQTKCSVNNARARHQSCRPALNRLLFKSRVTGTAAEKEDGWGGTDRIRRDVVGGDDQF